MIEIRWKDTAKNIPSVGNINTNEIKNVPDHIGRALIKQGQAVEVKPKKEKE